MAKPLPSLQTYPGDPRPDSAVDIVARRRAAKQRLPLDMLLDIMDIYYGQENYGAAVQVALEASKFVHPRLQDIMVLPVEERARLAASKGMSASDLEQLESLLEKVAGSAER